MKVLVVLSLCLVTLSMGAHINPLALRERMYESDGVASVPQKEDASFGLNSPSMGAVAPSDRRIVSGGFGLYQRDPQPSAAMLEELSDAYDSSRWATRRAAAQPRFREVRSLEAETTPESPSNQYAGEARFRSIFPAPSPVRRLRTMLQPGDIRETGTLPGPPAPPDLPPPPVVIF